MFWGLILKANRKYTQTIKKAFHLSHAALDITTSSGVPVQVVLTSDKNNYILCTLKKGSVEQVALDLNFEEGEEISFTSQGQGNVHLSGYLVVDEFDEMNEEDGDLDMELAETKKEKISKKQKIQNKDNDSDEEVDDDDDEELEDDDSEEDENDDESIDDSDEEEEEEPSPKQPKLEKPKQNGVDKQLAKKEKKELANDKSKGEKVLQGGVKIEDTVVGHGAEAKAGKKVQVYYEGRLKSNNKVFDSSKQGAGFKFGLGKNEVIKAWDIGVVGMKVGGKRRIICPPHTAYGSKGSPPVIPPNSTLVFEVELKGVH